jgi:hypothetical protein
LQLSFVALTASTHARRVLPPLGIDQHEVDQSFDFGWKRRKLIFCRKEQIPSRPPAKSPFATSTLVAPRISANSRFLTECYLAIAANAPNLRPRER